MAIIKENIRHKLGRGVGCSIGSSSTGLGVRLERGLCVYCHLQGRTLPVCNIVTICGHRGSTPHQSQSLSDLEVSNGLHPMSAAILGVPEKGIRTQDTEKRT